MLKFVLELQLSVPVACYLHRSSAHRQKSSFQGKHLEIQTMQDFTGHVAVQSLWDDMETCACTGNPVFFQWE